MERTLTTERNREPQSRGNGRVIFALVLIILAGCLAYQNSFQGEFIFDDVPSIVENPNITSLGAIGNVLSPSPSTPLEPGTTVQGRPLLSLSLAINYAFGGTQRWGYHFVNLLIHLANAVLIFLLVRGTIRQLHDHGLGVSPAAFAAALSFLWVVHPLTTNAVTYVVQRAESLGSLFILLSLLGASWMFSSSDKYRTRGLLVSLTAAYLGVLTKESAAVVPIAVLLYDRSYYSSSWKDIWKNRRWFYLTLAGCWILLALLMWLGHSRSGTVGFGAGVSGWNYLKIQGWAVLRYIRLSLLPIGLCFDYGENPATFSQSFFPGLIVGVILISGVWLWRKWPRTLFPLILFFLLLAPTSSFIPVRTHLVAEHRMYLPLACLLTFLGILIGRTAWLTRIPAGLRVTGILLLALFWGLITRHRNEQFQDIRTMWLNTWLKRPLNWRASNNYGMALSINGEMTKAVEHYLNAWQIFEQAMPHSSDAWKARANLAFALMQTNHYVEALPHLQYLGGDMQAPDYLVIGNLGLAQAMTNQPQAIENVRTALKLNPAYAEGHNNLGWILTKKGEHAEAVAEFVKALDLRPAYPEALSNLRQACQEIKQIDLAYSYARKARTADPKSIPIAIELANCAMLAGEKQQAIDLLKEEVTNNPDNNGLRKALGLSYLDAGNIREALICLKEVADRANPPDVAVLNNVAWILSSSEKRELRDGHKAESFARRALAIAPDQPAIYGTLAACFAEQGKYALAFETMRTAIAKAEEQGNDRLRDDFNKRLEEYRKAAAIQRPD